METNLWNRDSNDSNNNNVYNVVIQNGKDALSGAILGGTIITNFHFQWKINKKTQKQAK